MTSISAKIVEKKNGWNTTTAAQRWMVIRVNEETYQRIMNRLFFAAESVCGEDMVYIETVGDVIREECSMEGDEDNG